MGGGSDVAIGFRRNGAGLRIPLASVALDVRDGSPDIRGSGRVAPDNDVGIRCKVHGIAAQVNQVVGQRVGRQSEMQGPVVLLSKMAGGFPAEPVTGDDHVTLWASLPRRDRRPRFVPSW